MKVAIAIPTVERKALLKAAISSSLAQDFPQEELEIIVVDNSRDGAQSWVVDVFPDLDCHERRIVRHVREPRPGLASARNCAIVSAKADFLIFLDDDERPVGRDWLKELTHIADMTAADVVFGPVVPSYESEPEHYRTFVDKLYTRRLDVGDGSDISALYHYVGSGNSCFRVATCFRDGQTWFDERFNEFGGEDTELLRRLVGRGRRLAWAANAAVAESIPPSRTTVADLTARRFSKGQNRSYMQIATPPARLGWLLFWMGAGALQALYHKAAQLFLTVAGKFDAAGIHAIEASGGLGKVLWQKKFRARRYLPPDRQ
ncbi:MAG TPA: glycosyltransferase family A protein [Rhizomicrobium sp.]|nr:glycosyltransferase family A protein [Rhizomicrobium sp.]